MEFTDTDGLWISELNAPERDWRTHFGNSNLLAKM